LEFLGDFFQVAGLALPNNKDFPALVSQFFEIAFISFDVSLAFILPEFWVCGGFNSAVTAVVHMPETAVNKDYLFVPDHYKVRMAGQVAAMQGITITHSMNKRTHGYFRRGILGPDL
jgi:hypothetical protein